MNIDKKYLDERLVALAERKTYFTQQAEQMRANAIAVDGAIKDTQEVLAYLEKAEEVPAIAEEPVVPDTEVK
jgi:prefoldin subunit 5